MANADIDLTLVFRRKHTPPPSVLLLAVPNDKTQKEQQPTVSPTIELRSHQQKTRHTPHTASLNVNHSEANDPCSSSYAWQRHSDKLAQIAPAPDVAYRYTYLEEPKKDKSPTLSADYLSRSPSPRSQHSQSSLPRLKTASVSSQNTSNPLKKQAYPQYRTVYDYIRQSIKQIERQRNSKQNFSARIKRPQNDDDVLRRALGDKRTSATSKDSSLLRNDLRNPQSLVNYMNHSRDKVRVLHTTTPNQPFPIESKYSRPRTNRSQYPNDSLEKQQAMMMSATVSNS